MLEILEWAESCVWLWPVEGCEHGRVTDPRREGQPRFGRASVNELARPSTSITSAYSCLARRGGSSRYPLAGFVASVEVTGVEGPVWMATNLGLGRRLDVALGPALAGLAAFTVDHVLQRALRGSADAVSRA